MSSESYYGATLRHLEQDPTIRLKMLKVNFDDYESDAKTHISRNLISFRASLEISQDKFAGMLGISRSQYRKYESGDETIRLDVAHRITLKCGLPLFHLLQNSKYRDLIKIPSKNPHLDRILFYANSIDDKSFIALCQIMAVLVGNKELIATYQPLWLTRDDFAVALKENEEKIYLAIAEGIRATRMHFKLTQEDVADLMNVSTTTYQEYEKSVARPRFNMLMAVRWTVAMGIHPFVALAGTHFVKIRYMQARRLELVEKLLANCGDEQLSNLVPLIEGYLISLKNQSDSFLFTI